MTIFKNSFSSGCLVLDVEYFSRKGHRFLIFHILNVTMVTV